MNLETTPQSIDVRLSGIVLAEEQAYPQTFVVSRVIRAADPSNQVALETLFSQIIDSMMHQPWFIPEMTSAEVGSAFSRPYGLIVNFNGSLRETIANHVRFTLFNQAQLQGVVVGEISVKIVEVGDWADPLVVTVASEGKVFAGRFGFNYGDHYREDCSTCQQGKRLIQWNLDKIDGQMIINSDSYGPEGYAFGNIFLKPSENMEFELGSLKNGATIEERFKNWFIETNAGAIEMANIINVSFVGV